MNKIIYGIHTIQAMLKYNPQYFTNVYLLKNSDNRRLQLLAQQLKTRGIAINMVTRQYLDKQTKGAVHQGIVAYTKVKKQYHQEKDLARILTKYPKPLLLVLDGISDPHNLGACIRCANAAGVHAVITQRKRAAPLNATALKVACGAAETTTLIQVTNLARTLRLLQENGVWIVGAANEINRSLYQSILTGPLALVMGAEGTGMRRLTRKHCNELISIPMAGAISSLNVSVAAGICLFEAVRQRG